MRFSDSINYNNNIPKPIQYANSDSLPFNSSESLSDDIPSPDDPLHDSSNTNQNPSIINLPSNTTSPFKQILKAPDTNQ